MTKLSTLCYIEKDDKYLMLHRTVKENDVNKDKWIGVGGHFEYGESPEECLLREGTTGKFPVHLHLGIYIYKDGKEISVNPYAALKYVENRKIKAYSDR